MKPIQATDGGSIVLTKDLIRCRLDHGAVKPQFIDTDSAGLLGFAEQLIAVYTEQPPPSREEIDEQVRPLLKMHSDVVIARGLQKLLDDRCDFEHPGTLDYPALREILFRASAEILRQGMPEEEEDYQARVLGQVTLPDEFFSEGIYADLPENERLLHLREITPRQLLERYNVALVQSLLLRADRLEVVVAASDSAKLRRLLKYLRFFRLLARIYSAGPLRMTKEGEREQIRLVIDGPASLFEQHRRYGLQLASFFPAICSLETWRLDTQVEWKEEKRRLCLTEKTGLVSHYRNFSAYVPDEIKLFHRHFAETADRWRIVGHTPFLQIEGQELVFPDLSFETEGSRTIHLELFHRWHAGQVLQRLETLTRHPRIPLILGVDRFLLRADPVREALESSDWFAERGFLFRDYPTVANTLNCLEKTIRILDTE